MIFVLNSPLDGCGKLIEKERGRTKTDRYICLYSTVFPTCATQVPVFWPHRDKAVTF